jgi:diguanylate cyclase (GGDEF)-like protein
MPEPLTIVILAEPQHAAIWRQWLAADGHRVLLDPAELPPDMSPDVVLYQSAGFDQAASGLDSGESGWIAVGSVATMTHPPPPTGPPPAEVPRPNEAEAVMPAGDEAGLRADARLPDDMTSRELRLACSLVGQIARLRRHQRSGRRRQRTLRRLALTDPLTRVANRRAWDAELARHADAEGAIDPPLTVMLLDLDWFKHVNDRFGHAAGDVALRTAADALAISVRQHDFVARLGGDEFAVLLADLPVQHAAAAVERVRTAVVAALTRSGQSATASAGYAVWQTGMSPDELLAAADRALIAAKQNGRNRTVAAATAE